MKNIDSKDHMVFMLIGEEKWHSFYYFSPQIYPDYLKDIANSCSDRFALTLHYYYQLQPAINRDKKDCLIQLNRNCVNLNFPSSPERIAYYHSISTIACIHGFLYSVKSFLDIISSLWISLACEKYQDGNFSKKNIDGEILSGGSIINWLNRSSPASFTNSNSLAELIELNSKKWITEMVGFRDGLTHKGEISNLLPVRVKMEAMKKKYELSDLLDPIMPNKIPVREYFFQAITNLNSLIFESLTLFENIKRDQIKNLSIGKESELKVPNNG